MYNAIDKGHYGDENRNRTKKFDYATPKMESEMSKSSLTVSCSVTDLYDSDEVAVGITR